MIQQLQSGFRMRVNLFPSLAQLQNKNHRPQLRRKIFPGFRGLAL